MIVAEPKVHDFRLSLAASAEQADAPWWEDVYRKAFHNFGGMVCVRDDGWAQKGGIDRVVTLTSGKTLTIDEKARSQDYNDIALEYWSVYENRTPGWVAKDLACDFIAYAFVPSQRCYLLPFLQLRRAWRERGAEWVKAYRKVIAKNRTYNTVSVAVPIPVLLEALKDALVVSW